MKTINYVLAFVLTISVMSGCASVPRTKWTDPAMRVMIDPDSIEGPHFVRIQQSLMDSGKWIVVDRNKGYRAAKREQERLHRFDADRFMDREKYAHWGKLYGVGGVVVANAQCLVKKTTDFIIMGGNKYVKCLQHLAIVNANTGEVIATGEAEAEGEMNEHYIAPSWEDAVDKLNAAYPKNYQPNKDHEILEQYKVLSAEEAVRQKELPKDGLDSLSEDELRALAQTKIDSERKAQVQQGLDEAALKATQVLNQRLEGYSQ